MGPIAMPPRPEPSQASAAASAGTERWLPASAAITLRPTETIHNPPNEKARQMSATVATTHDCRVSMVDGSAGVAAVGFMPCSEVLPAMPGTRICACPCRRDMRWHAGWPRGVFRSDTAYNSTRGLSRPDPRPGPARTHPHHAEPHEEYLDMDDVTRSATGLQRT